ncbi:DnaK suppressor protein [Kluyvera cryocrescens]|uniref:DnaK suppressor protein n=1 Tax=Kluyvera cryocrescens TaxID=580 RepID=A0A485BIH3_KLUCR|nr:DnaK suppressor protein [Kluyvera cryocrescens]
MTVAAQEEEFSLELRNRDRERKLIKKIEKTLKKVEDEDFGYCESCGVEIGIRRLEARPTADLCIGLQNAGRNPRKADGRLIER